MEIIKNFGLDPVLLAAQIVNFLIILYVLRRFLYKPVFDLLKKRENTIKEGLEKTEEARKYLEKALEEEKEILKKAQTQALKLINEAKTEAAEILRTTEESSKKQAEKLVSQAKEQISEETREAEKHLAKNISLLAIEFLQKTVGEFFDEKQQEEIMSKAIRKLKQKPN